MGEFRGLVTENKSDEDYGSNFFMDAGTESEINVNVLIAVTVKMETKIVILKD